MTSISCFHFSSPFLSFPFLSSPLQNKIEFLLGQMDNYNMLILFNSNYQLKYMQSSHTTPLTFAIKPLQPTISKTEISNNLISQSNKLLYAQDTSFCWMPNELLGPTLTCPSSFQMNSEIQVHFLKQHKKTLAFLFAMVAQENEESYQGIMQKQLQNNSNKTINYEDECQKIFSTLSLDKSQTQEFKSLAGSDQNIYRTYVGLTKVIPKRYYRFYTLSFYEALKFNSDLEKSTKRDRSVMSKKLGEKMDGIIEQLSSQCLQEYLMNQSGFLFKVILTLLQAINGYFQNSLQVSKHGFEHEEPLSYRVAEVKQPKKYRIMRRKKQNIEEERDQVMKKRKVDDSF